MVRNKLIGKQVQEVWDYLVGSKNNFALEHRVFNSVCVLAIVMLTVFVPFKLLYLGLAEISLIFLAADVLCAVVYYISRFRKQYQAATTTFCVAFLGVLTASYFLNEGIEGPTLLGFLLSFQFVIAIKPPKDYWLWLTVHIFLVLGLFLVQGYHPEWIKRVYTSYDMKMMDTYVAYILILLLTFFTINFMRRNYHYEKVSAERRAESIETQHLQIAAQHLQLERLNQEKNKMFSIISHDLKSPLDSIRSYLELLSEDIIGPDERKEFEKQLLMVTSNTSELLQNLLSWSKSQMEGAVAKLIPVNLYQALYTSLDVQEKVAEKKGIRFTYSIDDALTVIADPDMLQLVVRNLVSNAIKFTEPGGGIQLKAYADGDYCRLAVKDTGRGIPDERKQDIFTLKTSSTYGTGNEKGVGLGLVLCKEFTELQGGRIWFESNEGQGTTFYLSLPLHNNSQMEMFG